MACTRLLAGTQSLEFDGLESDSILRLIDGLDTLDKMEKEQRVNGILAIYRLS